MTDWSLPSRRVPRQRAIIDRRALVGEIAEIAEKDGKKARPAVLKALQAALDGGRSELETRLAEKPSAGHEIATGYAFLTDQLVRVIYDYVVDHLYPVANRTTAERLAILAVGGYGRAEMAPHWCEQVIEAMLYLLWDLGLKIGHSSRTIADTMRMAKEDLTIRTALLEARLVWGDQGVYEELRQKFWSEARGTERQFLTQKLEERRTARAPFAISRRSTGSASIFIASKAPPSWSMWTCLRQANIAASGGRRASSSRCAVTCTC